VVKPRIEHEIPPQGIRDRPEITNGIGVQIGLGEMPELAGYCEFLQGARNGQRLAQLGSAHGGLGFLGHDEVTVIMKARHVLAHQDGTAFAKCSEVEFRRRALVPAGARN